MRTALVQTYHPYTQFTHVHPLGVMMIFGSVRARTGLRWMWMALAATAVLGVLAKVLPMFDQQNWNLIALVLPVSVAVAANCWLDHRRGPAAEKTVT